MAEIKVSRFETYPTDEPTGWAVGFTITCSNGRSFYIDTTVSYNEATTDEEAVNVAFTRLKDTIQSQIQTLEAKPSILGKTLTL